MKRIVVTGATSMIGLALINECIKNNVAILAIVRRNSEKLGRLPQSEMLTVCECNLDEFPDVNMTGQTYDVFYHFAWGHTSKANRDNPTLQEQNIRYTLEAVELANRLGCKKFIGAGSQAEYGIVHEVIRPDTKENPVIAYGIAKNAAGRLSRKLCEAYGMTHIWGRIFSVYGVNDNDETVLAYAIRSFINHETAHFSAATHYWDFLHEDDAGRIFYLLGELVQNSKVYCISGGQAKPLKEFILEVKRQIDEDAECEFAKFSDRSKVVSLQVDISELVRDINYEPQVSFEEGIKALIKKQKESI